MDTKLKKFSRSFFVRFIAVMLLMVLTLTNAFYIGKLARGIILFGAPAVTAAAEPVTDTNAFAASTIELISKLQMRVHTQNVKTQGYIEQKRAEIEANYSQAIKVYNEIIEDYNTFALRAANGDNEEGLSVEPTIRQSNPTGVSSTTPAQPSKVQPTKAQSSTELATAVETYVFMSEVTEMVFDADSNEYYPSQIESKEIILKRGDTGYWYYQFLNSGYAGNEDGISDFAKYASGYDNYERELNDLNSYADGTDYSANYFQTLDSPDYFIIDKKTGNYFTNIDGCKTQQQAAAALRRSPWYAFYSNDSFETNDKRQYNDTSGSLGDLYNMPAVTFGDYYYSYDIAVQRTDLAAASPYYWFLSAVGRYENPEAVTNDYEICIGFDGKFDGSDAFARINTEYTNYHADNYLTIGILSLSCFILFVALLAVTGKDENGKPRKYFIDRLWNDLHFVLSFGLIFGIVAMVIAIAVEFSDLTIYSPNAFAVICAIGFTMCIMLLLEWLTSVIRHARMKTYFRHTLCAKCFLLCKKFIKFCFRPLTRFFRTVKEIGGVKHLPRWIVAACLGVVAINAILVGFAATSHDFFPAFLAMVFDAGVIGVFLWVFVSLDKIMKAVDDTKNGKLDSKVDINNIFPLLREFANNVNTVGNGMQAAVDSAIKDQRMKAELITNVSHDLKTPLTSIVSYVDLLKRCEVQDEQARKYIDILDEKSQRMKKLIEDLVEASKVSSGSVELHPIKLNLCEIAVQAVGENSEKLEQNGIELRYRIPEQPVYIMADGQKTSRIIENLFSNVQKYAMPDTRVYAEVLSDDKFGALVIKNVSRYPLDISAAELTQRFVRGDAARSSEGSGLGLSIANNLCELQGGKCIIYVDGDLFKVTILLPIAK